MSWPVADLDTVRRLHVLAAAVPGAVVAETRIDAPFVQVRAVAADLQHELPCYLRRPLVHHRPARRTARCPRSRYAGLRARFDIVLRPGWCIIRSRFLLGGMAAVAEDDHTRFAFLSGVHIPAQRLAAPALAAFGRWAAPRTIDRFATRVRDRQE
jgi:hypothetical protein